ncbi:3-oxoacyl-ACP reductase [Streptomyces sp. VRA16 Mangrove soil]|uniref:3-oxoacyl-ACP reductase n=1 Tax=Streptomyces sp. VRA16 Mangrove soil TaxID=2817434 RepID=UPI001A9E0D98|nr:3-oxoacyl-ACP reductase [Streptomyces sp. VRA16 Mangrove soil]MBO1337773.1 3-oxoacyl-ACP reductase [Streptomyces sp. VRA16 Mangrove soil]
MADRYLNFTGTAPGRFLTKRLGLPQPAPLRRFSPGHPTLDGELLHVTAGTSAYEKELGALLAGTGPDVVRASERPGAVVVDATGVADVAALGEVHAALHPVVRSVAAGGRVVVLGAPPSADDHHQAAVQQGLEGFVRSLGKEIGRGRTVNLVRVAGPVAGAESTLRFLLSPKSAYVSGQVVEVAGGESELPAPENWDRPLAGRTALITGAARGIGRAVAETLVRDGAEVVLLDVPSAADDLKKVAEPLGGRALPLDITADDAGERIAAFVPDGLDVLVHNAGITRDRRLANMPAERWSSVLEVNLASVLRTTDTLLDAGAVRRGGAVVATASIAGIAGNAGQTNYAASKAGIVGLVRSLAPRALAEHGVTVNAVAPGFIETKMTAAVPLFIREAGRRMNSLAQGGLPVDVAETTSWFASPGSGAVNGQVVRVCGQSLLGA